MNGETQLHTIKQYKYIEIDVNKFQDYDVGV